MIGGYFPGPRRFDSIVGTSLDGVTEGNRGETLIQENKYPEAEKLLRETLDTERRTLGPQQYDALSSMEVLGRLLMKEKRYAEAEMLVREQLHGSRTWSLATKILCFERLECLMISGGFMNILAAIKREERKLEKQLGKLQHELNGVKAAAKALGSSASRDLATAKSRVLSAAGRASISRAAKKRWAKIRAQAKKMGK
jgi:hypothetical protein